MSVDEVVERILALREITRITGMITKRAQNELLASLPDKTLTEVAVRLQRNERNDHHVVTK
ncbi:MAG: hypothetical protein ACRD3E_00810 [Terriglobales bacterium]